MREKATNTEIFFKSSPLPYCKRLDVPEQHHVTFLPAAMLAASVLRTVVVAPLILRFGQAALINVLQRGSTLRQERKLVLLRVQPGFHVSVVLLLPGRVFHAGLVLYIGSREVQGKQPWKLRKGLGTCLI